MPPSSLLASFISLITFVKFLLFRINSGTEYFKILRSSERANRKLEKEKGLFPGGIVYNIPLNTRFNDEIYTPEDNGTFLAGVTP